MIRLQTPVKELVIVADNFHTKPLRHYLQSADRYQVLALTMDDIHLFEGNRHSLLEIALPDDFPKTITKALGEELTDNTRLVLDDQLDDAGVLVYKMGGTVVIIPKDQMPTHRGLAATYRY